MATRRKGLSPLERDLLKAATERPGGVVWMTQESLETLSQTYKAMVRLEKLELLERKGKDGLRWRVTRAGKTELTKEGAEIPQPPRIERVVEAKKALPTKKAAVRPTPRRESAGAARGRR